jgi:hypothetical protein
VILLYLMAITALGVALGNRLRDRREARVRLDAFKQRHRDL